MKIRNKNGIGLQIVLEQKSRKIRRIVYLCKLTKCIGITIIIINRTKVENKNILHQLRDKADIMPPLDYWKSLLRNNKDNSKKPFRILKRNPTLEETLQEETLES
jgi:hypothetical protein